MEEIPGTLKHDTDNPDLVTIETMEDYLTSEDIFGYWSYGSYKEYNLMELSNEVSSVGGTHSIRMHYQGADSISYHRATLFARSVKARGISLDIKGDGKCTVYLNLNWRNGSSLLKLRYELKNIPTTWTHYELGASLFRDINGSNKTVMLDTMKNIESISFGIVNSDGTASDIYIDNMRLIKDGIDYEDVNITPIS